MGDNPGYPFTSRQLANVDVKLGCTVLESWACGTVKVRAPVQSARCPARERGGCAGRPVGIRLSPLGVAVFCLLGLGVLFHLYSGFLAGRFSLFGLGGEPAGGPAGPVAMADGGTVDLPRCWPCRCWPPSAVRGGDEVRCVRESNVLHEKSQGKTREGADGKMTRCGDALSNRKMFYLLKTAFPHVQQEIPAFIVSC